MGCRESKEGVGDADVAHGKMMSAAATAIEASHSPVPPWLTSRGAPTRLALLSPSSRSRSRIVRQPSQAQPSHPLRRSLSQQLHTHPATDDVPPGASVCTRQAYVLGTGGRLLRWPAAGECKKAHLITPCAVGADVGIWLGGGRRRTCTRVHRAHCRQLVVSSIVFPHRMPPACGGMPRTNACVQERRESLKRVLVLGTQDRQTVRPVRPRLERQDPTGRDRHRLCAACTPQTGYHTPRLHYSYSSSFIRWRYNRPGDAGERRRLASGVWERDGRRRRRLGMGLGLHRPVDWLAGTGFVALADRER